MALKSTCHCGKTWHAHRPLPEGRQHHLPEPDQAALPTPHPPNPRPNKTTQSVLTRDISLLTRTAELQREGRCSFCISSALTTHCHKSP